ncbi:FAD-dependent monooxygenase [uncultured Tateyamaria sp.]|uniref:FAD-dependent monooxygenase n=1 Tax=uncultured Tateyamaria sp. TaxID=455651 RepID=UPI00262A308F|nr:FAD-dependent monooxygenase [uncultured Tateyamaria sp.]
MKAVVAGGGIGGLATAVALAMRGHTVEVYEQAPELTEIGAGLQISPNGWKVLQALGVADHLRATVFEPEAIEMRMGVSGRPVFRLPMKGYAETRWGAPFMHVHRADLVAALATRLRALAPAAIHVGQTIAGYAQDARHAAICTKAGDQIEGDVVIGADGLHSVIRGQMLGPDQPTYTGNVAWRAVVPVDLLGADAPPPTACIWAGDRRHAVTTRLRGGTLANFVGMVEEPEPTAEGWQVTGTRQDAHAAFAGWHPTISALIEHAHVLNRWALFDRAPLPRWSDGRVVVTGDAAHPMLPSMAQGAVQALEDAWTLADVLDRAESDVAGALAQFYAKRIGRVSRIQAGSRANARLFHRASLAGRIAFYGPMAIGARLVPQLIHARQDWVYRYDATVPS